MREIKFRGKRLDNGEWLYGDLFHLDSEVIISDKDAHIGFNRAVVVPATVGQAIDARDCNGMEIYEGDIISVCGKYNRVVEWCGLGWGIIPVENFYDEDGWREMMVQQPDIKWWNDHKDRIEIIGNIHDNPELLKTPNR